MNDNLSLSENNQSFDYETSIATERAKNLYNSFEHSSLELEQLLARAIREGSRERALEFLDQINANERADLSSDPLRSVQFSLIASCAIFTRAAISGGLPSESAFILSDLFIRELDKLETIQELNELEYRMVEIFIHAVNNSKSHDDVEYSHIVTRTRNNVQRNFMKKLSLSDVAEQVNVHPNYLAQQFKNETGQTIMEYYDSLRIEAICQYLNLTDMTMTELTELFDFSSSSHFSSFFKKHTKMSPSQYKKKSRKEKI